jgi:transcription initiation factor TFIIB
MSETTLRAYGNTTTPETTSETDSAPETPVTAPETTCPECGGQLESNEGRAETVCAQCGLVVDEDEIDPGPEWRAFDATERDQKARVGAPTTKLMHDKGLSSVIDWQDRDGYGNALSARQRQKMQRLRTWDERFRTKDHKERNLKQALAEIERMGSALGLADDVRETASVIYRRALEQGLLPGRSIEGISTAALYAAARQMQRPRSLEEVAAVSRVDAMEFKRAYRYINKELGLAVEPADPLSFVDRILDDLDVGDETRYRARELLRDVADTGVYSGKSPLGLAAAAIYAAGLITGDAPTQDAIGDAAGVSSVTIRNRYRELLEAADVGAEDLPSSTRYTFNR